MDEAGDADVATRPGRSHAASRALACLALVCALVALPLCLWLCLSVLSEFGSDRLYQAVTLGAHPGLGRLLDDAQLAAVILAVAAIVLGAVACRGTRSRRAGAARAAVDLGILGVVAVAAAFAFAFIAESLSLTMSFSGSGGSAVTTALKIVFALVFVPSALGAALLIRHLHRSAGRREEPDAASS